MLGLRKVALVRYIYCRVYQAISNLEIIIILMKKIFVYHISSFFLLLLLEIIPRNVITIKKQNDVSDLYYYIAHCQIAFQKYLANVYIPSKAWQCQLLSGWPHCSYLKKYLLMIGNKQYLISPFSFALAYIHSLKESWIGLLIDHPVPILKMSVLLTIPRKPFPDP